MKHIGIWCMSSALAVFSLIYNMAAATEGISKTLTVLYYTLIVLLSAVTLFLSALWYYMPRDDA